MAASSGDHSANEGGVECASEDDSACSTPFVSASSSPDRDPSFSAAGCFCSAPASPARSGGPGTLTADEYGCKLGFDFGSSLARDPSFSAVGSFYSAPASPARGRGPGTADQYGRELGFDFDFASRCPSPAAAAMSSADELFHNGQIRPMRLASFLLRPQALPPLDGDVPPPPQPPPSEPAALAGVADERGRLRRSRSMHHRRYRSLSPFRSRWLSPSPSSPAPAGGGEEALTASRSSSSTSTASSASSSSSRSHYRRWGFLKDIFQRSKSDGGGERPPLPSSPSPKRNASPSSPAPAASRGRGRARRSAHARLYEARRAEAEEMRRRTFLPYRQGLHLLGFLGLGSRGYGAMHGRAAAAAKARP